eukprot:Pgem_evm1s962
MMYKVILSASIAAMMAFAHPTENKCYDDAKNYVTKENALCKSIMCSPDTQFVGKQVPGLCCEQQECIPIEIVLTKPEMCCKALTAQ